MKLKLLFKASLLSLSMLSYAQSSFGIVNGITNSTQFNYNLYNQFGVGDYTYSNQIGVLTAYQGGLSYSLRNKGTGFTTQILYTTKGLCFTESGTNPATQGTYKMRDERRLNYLQVPIILDIYLGKSTSKFQSSLGVGLYYAYLVSCKNLSYASANGVYSRYMEASTTQLITQGTLIENYTNFPTEPNTSTTLYRSPFLRHDLGALLQYGLTYTINPLWSVKAQVRFEMGFLNTEDRRPNLALDENNYYGGFYQPFVPAKFVSQFDVWEDEHRSTLNLSYGLSFTLSYKLPSKQKQHAIDEIPSF